MFWGKGGPRSGRLGLFATIAVLGFVDSFQFLDPPVESVDRFCEAFTLLVQIPTDAEEVADGSGEEGDRTELHGFLGGPFPFAVHEAFPVGLKLLLTLEPFVNDTGFGLGISTSLFFAQPVAANGSSFGVGTPTTPITFRLSHTVFGVDEVWLIKYPYQSVFDFRHGSTP
jgi:hypothetical protein